MNQKTASLLHEMEHQGESAALSVADHLNTVASNDKGNEHRMSTDTYLIGEAENLIAWSQYFISEVKKRNHKITDAEFGQAARQVFKQEQRKEARRGRR